jgi:glycosyltransferase involved in cell wall biosynthesis
VALCTWNRAAELDRTLAAFCEVSVPAGLAWELLIVNNNSTDDTDRVVGCYVGRLPIVPLFEPRQGLSHARNLAVSRAAGDLIVFTDDDVLVDPCWLRAYVEAAERWPQAAYFGGPIALAFDEPPPRRLKPHLDWFCLGRLDLGDVERPLTCGEEVFGINMAFRRFGFEGRRFDPAFGVAGAERLAGEESLLIGQLQDHGQLGVWVPAAKVRHRVTADQLTNRWAYRNWVGRARTHNRLLLSGPDGPPAPRKVRLALSGLGWLAAWSVGRVLCLDRSVTALRKAAWHHGVLLEAVRSLRNGKPPAAHDADPAGRPRAADPTRRR